MPSLEARLADLIRDEQRLENILKTAFDTNPQSGHISVRLSKYYRKDSKKEDAIDVLQRCLEHSPDEKSVHLELAKIMIQEDEFQNKEMILSHLRKCFTDGDTNYDAQFWYARQLFIYGETLKADKYFGHLRKVYIPSKHRNKVRAIYRKSDQQPYLFQGTVIIKNDNFCFVRSSELNSNIFVYFKSFNEKDWDELAKNTLISFNLAFTLRGPVGVNMKVFKI